MIYSMAGHTALRLTIDQNNLQFPDNFINQGRFYNN